MAKNISNNQWFKDIKDNVYLDTAVLNNVLFITIHSSNQIPANTSIATLRNPELFAKTTNIYGQGVRVSNAKVIAPAIVYPETIGLIWLVLKSKQLETDFYSPEQLAEMYPDDPAFQVATADLPESDNPTLTDIDSDLSKVIPINEP